MAVVVLLQSVDVICHVVGFQKSVAHRRDNEVANQRVGVCQCLLDASSIGAVRNVEFCRDFLLRQGN